MKRPRKVDAMEVSVTAPRAGPHAIPSIPPMPRAMATGTRAFAIPKMMAPSVLASISSSSDMGARSSRSKDRPFFSKVTVTASMEVVPNKTATATTPGSTP